MVRTAVLVSGGGTNLQALIDAAARGGLPDAELALVVSNREGAFALERARRDSHHRARARLELDIQIIRLPIDAAHGGQRSIPVIGKIHHVPPHHRTGG